ncbi:hypothetical protein O6H91_Y022600 [Diphasiastrum complanatum]|nr:hypothetical protein O6H91_Y022600 [Diphasiastrum complanatum]
MTLRGRLLRRNWTRLFCRRESMRRLLGVWRSSRTTTRLWLFLPRQAMKGWMYRMGSAEKDSEIVIASGELIFSIDLAGVRPARISAIRGSGGGCIADSF